MPISSLLAAPVIVTGCAGFIGFHLTQSLLNLGYMVVGVDALTPYYDVGLKQARLAQLEVHPQFSFENFDLADGAKTADFFARHQPKIIIHLAAQPGVRAALTHPRPYVDCNVTAFLNVLEGARHNAVQHMIYASSSSVYGANTKLPFCETDPVDHPISLYAATKRANELMAETYARLFALPLTGLRFFTVYGPWGRPDMAVYRFVEAIFQGKPIEIAHNGEVWRDFTYVSDVVSATVKLIDLPPTASNTPLPPPSPADGCPLHRILNIGNDQPEKLMHLITLIEETLGKAAIKSYMPLPLGDVLETRADISRLHALTGFRPTTSLKQGVEAFVAWYRQHIC
jgi:UDP-glucuronate 4-epimerase